MLGWYFDKPRLNDCAIAQLRQIVSICALHRGALIGIKRHPSAAALPQTDRPVEVATVHQFLAQFAQARRRVAPIVCLRQRNALAD
jgi:hypothetical protein